MKSKCRQFGCVFDRPRFDIPRKTTPAENRYRVTQLRRKLVFDKYKKFRATAECEELKNTMLHTACLGQPRQYRANWDATHKRWARR